jgi:4-amino-4-deoxy-L-arabinose transferase-like glycosyltransferase
MSSLDKSTTLDPEAVGIGSSPIEKKPTRWSKLILILLLLCDIWYRAHTFGPRAREALGFNLWPATVGETEPLDCDEAAYAYIGHRILKGDVLYRDLTENKPPFGYWLYMGAIAVGGYNELAIRIMPIPFILATMAMVWLIGLRFCGPGSACLSAAFFMILSTDPYLFGNGANLEHFINFFSVASLCMLVAGRDRCEWWRLLASGACLGAAILVKQIAVVHVFAFAPFLLATAWAPGSSTGRRFVVGFRNIGVFLLGLGAVVAGAGLVLVGWGAGPSAYDDIVFYGRGLATDTLADPFAPPALVRWLTGNADPEGRLPWPFGMTRYLVWWGTGSWPIWLASIPVTAYLLVGRKTSAHRRLVAAWMIAACIEVALPGLYWQHYYLLPIAGISIALAVCFTDAFHLLAHRLKDGMKSGRDVSQMLMGVLAVSLLSLAVGATVILQVRDYLLVAPEELTIRYKGGGQWVVLRQMGRELARRTAIWNDPRLYVWGWQSPLYFYAKLDSPTRHFFVDNLLRDQADRNHPLIKPRTEEIGAVLQSRPPELIFTGYPPFRALDKLLSDRYLASRLARGLWVRREDYSSFEAGR